jgi:ribosomal protein L6P/L9E
MSRIGRMPIADPAGVNVNLEGNTVKLKGRKDNWKGISPRYFN